MTKGEKSFYFSKFKDKIFVLKIGGDVVQSHSIVESILEDIKELHQHGVKVVLVHGGGNQADALAKKLGHTPTKIDGRRVTEAKDLEIVKMLYGGSLNLEILSTMKKLGMKGMRTSGLDGGLLDVKMRPKDEVDYGFVGDIVGVNPEVILHVLDGGYVPVVSPLGVTDDGTIVNINADTIATEVAKSLKAEKLVFFTTCPGILDGGKVVSTLDVSAAKKAIKDCVITDGMIVKTHNCMEAVQGGVKRVHIIDGLSPHSLLAEVLTKGGIGTMITSDSEQDVYIKEKE